MVIDTLLPAIEKKFKLKNSGTKNNQNTIYPPSSGGLLFWWVLWALLIVAQV